jgi:hypothetical protein
MGKSDHIHGILAIVALASIKFMPWHIESFFIKLIFASFGMYGLVHTPFYLIKIFIELDKRSKR